MSLKKKCENCMFYHICPDLQLCKDFTPLNFDGSDLRHISSARDSRKTEGWEGAE